ncbi:efflux RND transporter periplasmic adaptor subunit [Terriglobus sp.]|uniref:efflux RND transporter periplasmic adaptor subunit n=1 Tax=Terriglobus sp. TaxID=1889013 RepID=UPI003AFF9B2F
MNVLQNRHLAATVLLTLVAGAAGCKSKEADAPEVTVTVQAAHPTQGPISEEISADAIFLPLSQAAIAPKVSSPIRAEYVQRGAHVRKGQLLISLEDRDLQGNALDTRGALTTAQASYTALANATNPEELNKAQTDVQQALAARDVAKRTADERRRLFQQGAIAGRDADTAYAAAVQAEALYETAQKHLDSVQRTTQVTNKEASQGQVTSARGRFLSAEAQVSYANLRSPIDGVVTERPLFPGETATAGTPVITVMDTSSLLAKLHLAQATAQQLGLGHKAEVQVPGMTDSVEATVSFISPALDPGSTTVEVWLKLPNKDGHFKVGTPVHATISGSTVPNALQVPTDSIVPSQDGGTSVMVIGPDRAVHKRPVKVGIRTPESVQILSGLALADSVVTSGGYGLDDGTKVTIGKPDAGEKD